MTLQPGARLGPYQVFSAIGAGGMGEVYRARDRKLQRDVAVKVLPEGFAQDAPGGHAESVSVPAVRVHGAARAVLTGWKMDRV